MKIKTQCSWHKASGKLYDHDMIQNVRHLGGCLVLQAMKVLELPQDARRLLKREALLPLFHSQILLNQFSRGTIWARGRVMPKMVP